MPISLLRACVAIALMGAPLAPPANSQQDVAQLYEEAHRAQQSGDLRTAVGRYEQIVKIRPDIGEAFANLGSLYYQLGDPARATIALKQAIAVKPKLTAPYFFLGVIASTARRYSEAIGYLKGAANRDPNNPAVAFYLGASYYGDGRYDEAVEAFVRAAESPDFQADAYYHLSKAFAHVSERTVEELQRCCPQSLFVDLARANVYETRGDWERAQQAYASAMEKGQNLPGLRDRLQWTAQKAIGKGGDVEDPPLPTPHAVSLNLIHAPPAGAAVVELFHNLRAEFRQLASANAPQDEMLYRRAEYNQALSYLAALWISENDPDSYRAHQLRGQLYDAQGKADEAVAEYRRALESKPDLQNVRFAIGSLYWAAGLIKEAEPELRAELEINPHHAEAHYELSDILYNRGKLSEAKQHLLEALRIEPEMLEAHLGIERIYSAEEEYAKALDHLRKVIEAAPLDPTPHYRMATIYRRIGEPEKVAQELEIFRRLKAADGVE